MLLFVTGPAGRVGGAGRDALGEIASAWAGLAERRSHPRLAAPLIPAVTRFDLFLAAFSPAADPGESGYGLRVPPPEQWWRWVPDLRGALRDLIRSAFPPGPRYGCRLDPVGQETANPIAAGTPTLNTLAAEFRAVRDPAQRPADPRLWLVLAPPLPEDLEEIFLATFLRAEPFARVARVPEGKGPIAPWLEREVDCLLAGEGLATRGLVTGLVQASDACHMEARDAGGRITACSDFFDLVSGLEDLYATKEMLAPGEVYNRLHSHTASEELYILLEGEGVLRVNERALPFRAGQCFGKPRGYDCSTQILNTGEGPMVFLDVGTVDPSEVDIGRYPEHGELLVRFGGHRWFFPSGAIRPGAELGEVYDRRYFRTAPGPEGGPGPDRSR